MYLGFGVEDFGFLGAAGNLGLRVVEVEGAVALLAE